MAIENHELLDIIKAKQGELSLRSFATSLGFSAAYLSDVYRNKRPVGPNLAKKMGFEPVTVTHTTYKKLKRIANV